MQRINLDTALLVLSPLRRLRPGNPAVLFFVSRSLAKSHRIQLIIYPLLLSKPSLFLVRWRHASAGRLVVATVLLGAVARLLRPGPLG